jgi:hypothetical protein
MAPSCIAHRAVHQPTHKTGCLAARMCLLPRMLPCVCVTTDHQWATTATATATAMAM